MNAQIRDLETKLQKKDIRNEVVVPTDKEIMVYVGEATNLYFNGMDNIRGVATLSKYKRTEGTKIKGKLQCSPLKFQIQKVPFIKDKIIWTIVSQWHVNFLSQGKLEKRYQASLKDRAINYGSILSNKLVEMIFEPIDSEIMKMHKQVRYE